MTSRTRYTLLLALLVGVRMALPVVAGAHQTIPLAERPVVPDRLGEPVTVVVTNNNWLDVRVYVVETTTLHRRWRLGNVTGLTSQRFEIPQHLGADLGTLVLVAEAIGSNGTVLTDRLPTWPGAVVNWTIGPRLSLSYASVS